MYEAIHERIAAALARNDRVAASRARFQLPLSEREPRGGVIRYDQRPVQLIQRDVYESRSRSSSRSELRWQDRPLAVFGREVLEKLRGARNGREDGGWLIGPYQDSSRAVFADRAVWAADDHDRGVNSLRVHLEEVDQINSAFYPSLRVNGHWHSQPSGIEPSAADIELWRAARDYLGGLPFIGLITQDRLTRGALVARAFVFTRSGYQEAKINWRNLA